MDWAVWDQTHDQCFPILFSNFARESSYMGHEWQCGFYFGYGIDVFEENALNEKYCIQVLRVLITKASTEILELEEDLITLQSQLALADESWSEICFADVREKIDHLDISIQSLKNINAQDEHDFGVCLLLHREPAERMHEIVKALLNNYFHQKDEQSVDIIVKLSSSVGVPHGTDLVVEKKRLSYSDSETIRKEAEKEPANSIDKASRLDSSTTAASLTNGKKIFSKLDSESNRILKASKYGSTPADNCMIQKSSIKTPVKRRNHQEPNEQPINSGLLKEDLSSKTENNDVAEKGKRECTIIKDSTADVSGHSTDDSIEKKELNKSDLIINGTDGLKKQNSASKEISEVLNSSLKPARKGRKLPRTLAGASCSDASKHAVGPKRKNKLSGVDSKVNGAKEIEEHNSTDQSIILKSSLQHGARESNISEIDKPADHVVEFRSSALREVTEESQVNPKLREDQDSALTDKIEPPLSSLKSEKRRIITPRRMKGPAGGLTDTEQNAADSLLELLSHKREHINMRQPKEEQKQKSKLAANYDESNSYLPLKPQKQRAKREHQQKQKAKSDLHVAKEQGVAPDVIEDLASQSQKKRKSQSSPGVGETKKLKGLQISVEKLYADTVASSSVEDLCIAKFSFTGPDNETPKLLPSTTVLACSAPSGLDLECLTLVDLRAVAKQHNLRGYSKLKKAKLAEELSLKLMVGGKEKEIWSVFTT